MTLPEGAATMFSTSTASSDAWGNLKGEHQFIILYVHYVGLSTVYRLCVSDKLLYSNAGLLVSVVMFEINYFGFIEASCLPWAVFSWATLSIISTIKTFRQKQM